MAITGIGSSYNGYESAYVSQKNEAAKKAETNINNSRTSAAQSENGKGSANNKVSEYNSYLSKNYDCVKNGNVTIAGSYLRQCANDPEKAKELEENLSLYNEIRDKGYANAKQNAQKLGARLVSYSENWSIDNTGNITMTVSTTVTSDTKGWKELKEEQEERLKEKKEKAEQEEKVKEQKEKTKETSAAQKKTDTESKGSLLSRLQDKYSNFDITAGIFSKSQISSKSRGFQGVMVNPAYLAKAENNEKTAKELDEMLSGVESAKKWLEDACKRDGLELISCGYFINENGEMGSWSVVKKKDSMFDGLAEQSEKDADRIKEKQEKTREQKKADEKKAEKKEAEEKQEQRVKSSKDKVVVVASSKEELLEKAKDAANGKNETNEKVLAKEEKALGNNFDYSI